MTGHLHDASGGFQNDTEGQIFFVSAGGAYLGSDSKYPMGYHYLTIDWGKQTLRLDFRTFFEKKRKWILDAIQGKDGVAEISCSFIDWENGVELKNGSKPLKSSPGAIKKVKAPACDILKKRPLHSLRKSPALGRSTTERPDNANLIASRLGSGEDSLDTIATMGRDKSGRFLRFLKSNRKRYHPWESLGEDQLGIYTEYQVKGVAFRMRWIWPGTFMMGSSDDEFERNDNETRHEVTLTRGFWLADTACTQALWQAVMKKNPIQFKGEELPVDTVSWEGCQTFLAQINGLLPGLNLGLPTEAQWEYACRAGSQTPFSFGRMISTGQANFDGNYSYAGADKEEYRKTTVPVKARPCNDWGLYQMHGNVYEWCRDWYGDYDLEDLVDPEGPDTGGFRVLRGGSWFFNARRLRSAFRLWHRPSVRDFNFGFRLAQAQFPPDSGK